MTQFAIDQRNLRIARTGNQNAEAVGDAGASNGATFRRYLLQGEIGDEAAEVLGERAHVRPPLCDRAGQLSSVLSLGGFQQRRRAGAELLEQGRFVGLGRGEMLLLDVT